MTVGRGHCVRGSCGLVVRLLAAWLAVSSSSAIAQSVTWLGAGSSGVWSDSANWSAALPSTGGALVFSGTTLTSSTNNSGSVTSAAGLTFANNGSLGFSSGFSLSGDAISLTGADSLVTSRAFSSSAISDTIALSLALDATGGTNRVTAGALHNLTLSGNVTGTGALVKLGSGTVTLSGNNTNSGSTSVLAGGLVLDYSTNNSSKLADTAALTLGSGTLSLAAGSHTEVVQSTSVTGAATLSRTSGSSILQLGGISRQAGGVLNVSGSNIATTTTGVTNGILGGWVTVGGTTWATVSSGTLVGLATTSYTALPTSGLSATTNYEVFGTTVTLAASGTINSLRGRGTSTVAIGSNTLTVDSGGVLGAPANDVTISGRITAGAGSNYELVVISLGDSAGATGRIQMASGTIADNGANAVSLMKAGPGLMALASAANTYTGVTRITQGLIRVNSLANGGAASPLGQAASAAGNIVLDGGGLEFNGNFSTDRLFTLGVAGGRLTIFANSPSFTNSGGIGFTGTGSRTLTFDATAGSGSFTPVIGDGPGGATTVVRSGSGVWTLSGANTYTGPTLIAATSGTLSVTSVANGGSASAIGASTSDAGNLLIDNGMLRLVTANTVQSTDRLFTVGAGGAILDSSGGANSSMVFTGTGPLAFVNDGARTLTLQGIRTGTFAPRIGDGSGGATSLVKSGTGSWTLTGSNTFTGSTTVSAGTLTLGNVNALRGSTLAVTGSGGVAFMAGTNTFNLGGLSGTANLGLGTNSLAVGWNSQTTTYSGTLSGATSGLTKTGSGGLTLSAAHTYGGDTIIAGGTLALGSGGSFASSPRIVVGNAGSSGAVLDLTAKPGGFTFSSTQTVQGIGTIRVPGSQTVTISGTLSPGNSPGTLTIAGGDLILGGSSLTVYEINGTNATVGGGINDLTSVSGSLALGGTLNVSATPALDVFGSRSYRVFDYATSGSGSLAGSIAIGTTPSTDFLYSLDTASAGQVNLFVQRKAEQAATLAYVQPTSGTASAFANANVTFTGTLTNLTPLGGVALGVSLADGGGQLTVGSLSASSGTTVAAGSSATISGIIATGTTLGIRTWGVVNTDTSALTSTTSSATGTLNVVLHGTPTLSGSSLDFGYVLVGSSTSQTISVSNGTLDSPALNTAGITWTSGSLPGGFTGGGANSVGVIASGSGTSYSYSLATGSAGLATGSQAFAFADDASVLGSGVLGSLSVFLTGTVLDPAKALLAGGVTSGTNWNIDLGSQNQGVGAYTQGFSISNLLQTLGYTADLRLLLFTPALGNGSEIGITLTGTNEFPTLAAGSGSNSYLASLDLASVEGTFTNSYSLSFGSFQNGSWLGDTQNVLLTVTGTIVAVPEPATIGLAGCGLGVALWIHGCRRRRNRV